MSIPSHRTRDFRDLFDALPADVRVEAIRRYRLFMENPSHASLAFKCKDTARRIWGVRAAPGGWRALAFWLSDGLYWLWIGRHDEYDLILGRAGRQKKEAAGKKVERQAARKTRG